MVLLATPFDEAKAQAQAEFDGYNQNEMKAFKSYSQTLDGIENRINPYQHQPMIPSTPPKVLPKGEPKDELIVKNTNTLPANTPSGSQVEAVKKSQTPLAELIAPVTPVIANVVTKDELKLDFLGTPIALSRQVLSFKSSINPSMSEDELKSYLRHNAKSLSQNIKRIQNDYLLNDWDTFIFVQLLVNTIYSKEDLRVKTIHMGIILEDLGYKTLIAKGEDKNLYLLIPTVQIVYSKPYYEQFGQRYYLFRVDEHPRSTANTSIYFSPSLEEPKGRAFDMVMSKDPQLTENIQKIKLSWDFKSKNYSIIVGVNKNLLALQDMYPQVDVVSYMESRAGYKTRQELTKELLKMIEKERLNNQDVGEFILRFGQKSFAYKTDFDAYGYERPLFLEQTLALPYSDCEDRAILLSHLYREIMGVKSVGLHYTGHIALGVALNDRDKGDYYEIDQKRYFVADGTYFYAPIGVSQPEFKGKKAKIIKIKG
jgi:hypothetical protein